MTHMPDPNDNDLLSSFIIGLIVAAIVVAILGAMTTAAG